MNKIFKVIWSKATGSWRVVGELTHAHGKGKSECAAGVARNFTVAAILLFGANDGVFSATPQYVGGIFTAVGYGSNPPKLRKSCACR